MKRIKEMGFSSIIYIQLYLIRPVSLIIKSDLGFCVSLTT